MNTAADARKAIFIDKDGTLIEDVPFNVDPQLIQLSKGVREGLRLLAGSGYELFVVTNQSGIALGYFEARALFAVHEHLVAVFEEMGCRLGGFYFCPHHPSLGNGCECHKPLPGLILKACREHRLLPINSWMIGDILNDVEAGKRAGCRTVLIDNGNETEWELSEWRTPDVTADDFHEAVTKILAAA
jgi:D-glycero-D-manno-heptose 1,7-bisphosphate phosphatase